MTELTGTYDPLTQFEAIEKDLPFVIFNEKSDLQKQLDFFLNICFTQLKTCESVDIVFPMFYRLTDWNTFSTELINPLSYLSRYKKEEFETILNKQLTISKKANEYSFTRQLLEIQNNPENKKRFNIIITKGDQDVFEIDECNLKFCFSKLFDNSSSLRGNILQIVDREKEKESDSIESFSPPSLPGRIKDEALKMMFIPSYIHTIYLKEGYKIYYIFSNCVSKYKDNTYELESTYGLGGIFVLMKDIYRSKDVKEKKFIKVLERITDKVANRIVNHFQLSLIQKHATRAAISQVMARNMSHNIGSHVLSKLLKLFLVHGILKGDEKWQLRETYNRDKVDEKLFEDIQKTIEKLKPNCELKDGCGEVSICIDTVIKLLDEHETRVFQNYSLLATFFHYLKARMDYLADVTTSTPVMENTKGLYNDMVKPFIINRVLNDRISGLDKFYYKITVCKPDSRKSNGKKCEEINTKEDCNYIVNDTNSNKDDILLSIPNDVLGVQAFYIILENIIRNTAKHGTTPVKKENKNSSEIGVEVPFEFKIKVEEASQKFATVQESNKNIDLHLDEYFCISIFDNCDLNTETEIDTSEFTTDEDKKKIIIYREKKIREVQENGKFKIKKIDKLVIDQNYILNKSILEDNKLRYGGWGLIEMDASAAYLRKIDIELIDSDEYSITDFHGENPVTEGNQLCIYQAYAEQDKYLGYRFFVRKPQEILIIGDANQLFAETNQTSAENDITSKLKELKNKGIWIKSAYTINKELNEKKDFPYRLIVLTEDEKAIEKTILYNPRFSKRILTVDNKNLSGVELNTNKIWNIYYENISHYSNTNFDVLTHGNHYCEKYYNSNYKFLEIRYSAVSHFFDVSGAQQTMKELSFPIKIAVIDERIQLFGKERYPIEQPTDSCQNNKDHTKCFHFQGGVDYFTLYRKTNILVPKPEECNVNDQNFDKEREKIIEYIFKCTNEIKKDTPDGNGLDDIPCTFTVIHMGVIEKLIMSHNRIEKTNYNKENSADVARYIKEKILTFKNIYTQEVYERYDSIVITSGRGKPHNLPDDVRYINFSVISQYMQTLRNKFALTEALHSSRSLIKNI